MKSMGKQMRKMAALTFLLLQTSIAFAQLTITGKVTDAANGEELPGVTVIAGKIGTVTNAGGNYTLSVTPQNNSEIIINFSCIGYKKQQVTLSEQKSQTLNVKLQSDQKLLSEVVVNGRPYDFGVQSPQMGAVAVSQIQIKSLPVVFGEPDLLKTLQTTPGVQSGRTGNAGIMVRGGNFDQNNMMIDGAQLYSAEHMRGFVSAVNPDMISTLAFYRGAFPTQYSGRLSSIIDISAKEGDFYKYHGELSLGTAMGRLTVSGPIIKGITSFAVAARMSYFGLIYQKIVEHHYKKINQSCPYSDMEFWDVNAKIVHKLTDNDKLSLTVVKDHDRQNIPQRTASSDKSLIPYYITKNGEGVATWQTVEDGVQVGNSVTNTYSQPMGDDMKWGNTLGSFNWSHRWNGSDKNFNFTAAYSEYNYKRKQNGVMNNDNSIIYFGEYKQRYNDSIVSKYSEISSLQSNSKVQSMRLAAAMNHPLGDKNTLVYGMEFKQSWFNPCRYVNKYTEDYKNWSIWDQETGKIIIDHRDELTVTDIDSVIGRSHKLSTFNVYLSDEIRFKRFKANVGINLAMYKTSAKTYFYPEPRVALSLMVSKNSSIKASATRISQAERLLSSVSLVSPNDIWVPATDSVPPMRSTQFALSFNHQFPLGIDFSVEGYYKTTKGNIDYLEGTDFNSLSTTWQDQITIGKSRSYGVEVLLQKFSGATNGWISYTWSRSFDKFDALGKAISNGKEIPSLADRPHNLAVNLSQRWWGISGYPRNHFDVSVLFKYMSGRRVTIPDHVSYGAMTSIADHYISYNQGPVYDSHLGATTLQYDKVTTPSEAFDLYMRFNGYSQRYNYILPYEMTLDFNLSLTMVHRVGESKVSLGVTNVLNRKNVSTVYLSSYADGKRVVMGVCDFPITPSISYTYSF